MHLRKFRSSSEQASRWLPAALLENANAVDDIHVHKLEYVNSIKQLTYENEMKKNVFFFSEGLIQTYPTAKFINVFRKSIDRIVPDELKELTFSDIQSWSDDKTVICKYIDKTSEIHGVSALVSFALPVFKSKLSTYNQKIKDIADSTRVFGYDLSTVDKLQHDIRDDIVVLIVQFEAKYPNSKFEIADVLLHIAPAKCFQKIKKQGLVPKSKSNEYSYMPRIYLFNQCSQKLALQYGQYKANIEHDAGFYVFKIQKKNLISSPQWKNGKLSFYIDSAFECENCIEAMFTYNNICLDLLDDVCLKYSLDDISNAQLIKFKT